MKQPEALRLADALDACGFPTDNAVSAELRRLHEANQAMLSALKELVAQTDGNFFAVSHSHVSLKKARAAIAKGEKS